MTAISRTANGVDATFADACVLKTEFGDAYGEQQKHSSGEPSGSGAGIPGHDQAGNSFPWNVSTIKLSLGSTLLSSAWQSPGTVISASAQMSTKAATILRVFPHICAFSIS